MNNKQGFTLEELQAKGAKPLNPQPTKQGFTLEELQAKGAKPLQEKVTEQQQGGIMSRMGKGLMNFATSLQKPFVDVAAMPVQGIAKLAGIEDPYKQGVPTATGVAEVNPIEDPLRKAGSALQVGSYAVPGSTAARLAVAGGMQGAGSAMSEGKDARSVATEGLVGAGLGAGFGAVSQAFKGAKGLLSKTSEVPEQAFDVLQEQPKKVAKFIKEGVDGGEVLKVTQDAVRGLRTNLTSRWKQGTQSIYNQFGSKSFGASGELERKLMSVADDFALDLPSDIKDINAKEAIELMTQINELPSNVLSFSPKGAAVRRVKELLKQKMIDAFGGKGGEMATLYSDYSAKKQVLDAADDIVRAYKMNKPITQATAAKRLSSIFDENKEAYLKAIKELEAATGVDIVSRLAASKFSPVAPITKQGMFSVEGLMDLMLLPISSPRAAGFISRYTNAAAPSVSGLASVLTKTGAAQEGLMNR